jgi:hypothetical protein
MGLGEALAGREPTGRARPDRPSESALVPERDPWRPRCLAETRKRRLRIRPRARVPLRPKLEETLSIDRAWRAEHRRVRPNRSCARTSAGRSARHMRQPYTPIVSRWLCYAAPGSGGRCMRRRRRWPPMANRSETAGIRRVAQSCRAETSQAVRPSRGRFARRVSTPCFLRGRFGTHGALGGARRWRWRDFAGHREVGRSITCRQRLNQRMWPRNASSRVAWTP